LPKVKVGCHKANGQKRIEMIHWTQLCSPATVAGVPGTWGDAVLKKTPIRMYAAIKRPLTLKRVFKKSTQLILPVVLVIPVSGRRQVGD
jgi:hypothetical protein